MRSKPKGSRAATQTEVDGLLKEFIGSPTVSVTVVEPMLESFRHGEVKTPGALHLRGK